MLLFWESSLQPCFLIWGLSHCVGSWWSVGLAAMWNCQILTTPSSLGVAGHVTWTQPVRPSCPGLIIWGWGVSQQPEACVAGVSSGGVASVPREVVLKEVTQLPVSWSPGTTLVSVLFQAVLQLSLHDEFPNILPEHSYFWDRSSSFFLVFNHKPWRPPHHASGSRVPPVPLLFIDRGCHLLQGAFPDCSVLLWLSLWHVFSDSSLRLWATWGHGPPLIAEFLGPCMGLRTGQLVRIWTKLPLGLLVLGKSREKWCLETGENPERRLLSLAFSRDTGHLWLSHPECLPSAWRGWGLAGQGSSDLELILGENKGTLGITSSSLWGLIYSHRCVDWLITHVRGSPVEKCDSSQIWPTVSLMLCFH